jgi:hypothetical protein
MNKAGNYEEMVRQAERQLAGDEMVYNASDEYKSAVSEGIKQLQDKRAPFSVSDLTPRQIMLIHKLLLLHNRYPFVNYRKIAEEFGLLLWSKNRSSRRELSEILGGLLKQSKKKLFGGTPKNDSE